MPGGGPKLTAPVSEHKMNGRSSRSKCDSWLVACVRTDGHVLALAGALLLGCSDRFPTQELLTPHGRLIVHWSGARATGIDAFSKELPQGYVKVRLDGPRWSFFGAHGRNLGEVTFDRRSTSVTSKAILFHEESRWSDEGYV